MIGAIRLFFLVVIGFSYVIAGVLLIPFGKSGKFYRWVSGYFGIKMLWLAGGKGTWSGLEKLDPEQCYVLVGNHQSYVDIFLMQAALFSKKMRTLFMVKKELEKIPLFGKVTKEMGLVPVERGESRAALKAINDSVKTLKDGYSLLVFPEGTRSDGQNVLPFKRGAFLLAEKAKMPIVPFAITGTSYIMPKNKLRVKGGPCHVTFGEPIMPGDMKGKELMEYVEKIVNDLYYKDKKVMDKKWQK